MITRRNVLTALGLNALAIGASTRFAIAAPPPGKTLRVGLLYGIRKKFEPETNADDRALVEGLRARGYVPGRNLVFEFRSAAGNLDRLPAIAAELVQLKVELLITLCSSPTLAARGATSTIPIVMIDVADPVAAGLVASLARPGGNVTGLSVNAAEIAAKRVQLLKDAVPKLARVAVLWNSSLKAMTLAFAQIEAAAPILGVTVQSVRVASSADFDRVFAALDKDRPQGLVVLFGPLRGDDLPRIVEYVTQKKIPTIFELGRGVTGGGLMEFGTDRAELAGHVGAYVDKIANGAKPADLPVEEPTKFQFVINLKAAKAMGLTIPASLLTRADRVME